LEDTEQVFIQLEKAQKKYNKDILKAQELSNAVFTLIEQKPAKGRLYGYVMDLIRNFEDVYNKFNVPKKPTPQSNPTNYTKIQPDILDEILANDAPPPETIFSNFENAKVLAFELVEKIADVKAENKEKTDNEAVYEAVSTALRELQGLSIDADTAKLDGIKNKLDQIQKTCAALQEQVKAFEN
jgi:hypothetical protein